LAGLKLTLASSPETNLANAAEELTFGVDNSKESELKERKEKRSIDSSMVAKVKLYQELMALNGRFDRLVALASSLKGAKNPEKFLEEAKKQFPDPADAYAALSELAESTDKNGLDPELIKAALAELDKTSGPEIRASLAGALVGQDFSDLGGALELKGDYVRAAIDFPDPQDMLSHVLSRYGPEGFERGLDFLSQSLAADLAADSPSRDKSALASVANQLGQLRILNGVRALGEKLLERWAKVHGQTDSGLTDQAFLKFVLEGRRENYPSASIADPLVALARPKDIETEVLFRQDLLNSVKSVAVHVFGDHDKRERFMGAVQEGLDLAVAREDEYLASMED
jgi:type III secretion protein W